MTGMDAAQVRKFLSYGTRTGKLATVRADGSPHVVPIWFVLDGDDLVFTTAASTVKAKALLADGRVSICVDDQTPPYSYVTFTGIVETTTDPGELLRWASRIGGRYMGEHRADEFGRRNGGPGELLVRVRPTAVTGHADIAS